MNRRLFILSSSSGLISVSAPAAADVLVPKLRFRLEDGPTVFSEVVAAGDVVYALGRPSATTFNVVCATSKGGVLWKRTLPPGLFAQLNVRQGGQIVLLCIKPGQSNARFEHVQFARDFQTTRSTPLGEVPIASCVVGDAIVGVFGTGSVGICFPDKQPGVFEQTANVMPLAPLGKYLSPVPVIAIEAISDVKALVIDQPTARIASIRLTDRTVKREVISAPETSASITIYAKELEQTLSKTENGRVVPSGTPKVIHAASGDRNDAAVYCMISPIDAKSPLVLKVTETGKVVRRLRCTLPSDTLTKKFKVPHVIRVIGRELLLAFPDGDVFVYDM